MFIRSIVIAILWRNLNFEGVYRKSYRSQYIGHFLIIGQMINLSIELTNNKKNNFIKKIDLSPTPSATSICSSPSSASSPKKSFSNLSVTGTMLLVPPLHQSTSLQTASRPHYVLMRCLNDNGKKHKICTRSLFNTQTQHVANFELLGHSYFIEYGQ